MKDLRERVVVVTGAASGIGRATAEAFLGRGAIVYGADIDAEGLGRVAAESERRGGTGQGRFVPCTVDVRHAEEVKGLADRVFAAEGRVDVLVNNAGVAVVGRVETLGLGDWRRAIDINLLGVVHGVWAFVPRMVRQGRGGHLVNTASVAGLMGFPICAPYAASKFGVVGMGEALQGELAASGIRVTTLCPGMVRTALLENSTIGMPPGGRGLLERAIARFALSPEAVAAEVIGAVEQGRSGLRVLGLGTAPLWWMHRISGRGYDAAFASLAKWALGRSKARADEAVGADTGVARDADSNPRGAPGGWGVVIVHPSRRKEARNVLESLASRLLRERPGYVVWSVRSSSAEVLAHARNAPEGAVFRLVPLLLGPGAHYQEDVAALANEVRQAAPGLAVEVSPPLLEDEAFLGWLFDQL